MDKVEILNLFPFYRQATPTFRQEVEGAARVVQLPTGAFYLNAGDSCDMVPLIGQGRLRVFKNSECGREVTLYHVGAGQSCLLNLCCVLSDVECPGSAVVEHDVSAAAVPASTFRGWMAANEQVRGFAFALVGSRMVELMELLEEISFRKVDHRLADFLLRRTTAVNGDTPVLRMTHEDIASELGTAREVVSRLLKEFERLGAVKLGRARIQLCNVDKLLAHCTLKS